MFTRDCVSSVIRPAVAAALATTVVILPQLAASADQATELPAFLRWAWQAALLTAAPVAAYVVARRSRGIHAGTMALAGVPQVMVVVALIRLDVWLDVRSGYLLADSGEEAMAYGLGTIIGALLGLLLSVLVSVGAVLGNRASRRMSRPASRELPGEPGSAGA